MQSQSRGAVRAGRPGPLVPMLLIGALIGLGLAKPAHAVEEASCRTVRLSDIGWTDVTATTALVSTLLRDLGYEPQVTVLSVPVTYASMKNQDIDVFLGNWMPTMDGDRRPFIADGSVEVVGANLVGAKYTLGVPAYTYDAGPKDFADIQRFAAALNHSIYGIEPGNDGNGLILSIIAHNQFNLGSFKLIESSEQGMLAVVERAIRTHSPIVFLAWDPHPMNMRDEAWFYVADNDVFPETFINFLAFDDAQRAAFMRVHGEILGAGFWRHVQQRLGEGELLEVLPYQPHRVRVASSA